MRVSTKLNLEYEAYALYSRAIRDVAHYAEDMSQSIKDRIDRIYNQASSTIHTLTKEAPGFTEFLKFGVKRNENFNLVGYAFYVMYKEKGKFDLKSFIDEGIQTFFDGSQDVDYDDLFGLIDQSNLQTQEKWYIFWLISNPEGAFTELEHIISSLKPLIANHEKEFKTEIEKVALEWQELVDTNAVSGFISENLQLLSKLEVDIYYVSIISINTIIFTSRTAYLGLQFTMDFFKKLAINEDTAVKRMKLLGDSSKYGILKELKSGKKYGRELAQNLNLSAATISYHIQELLNEGLVGVSSDESSNRIYYQLTKSKILETINFIKDDLDIG